MRDRIIPFRTENQADWRVLIRMRPVHASVVQVKVHLKTSTLGRFII